MKEVKFRVWDRNEEIMAEITSIRFSKSQHTLIGYRYSKNGKVIDNQSYIDENGWGTAALMQYTGLKDKNGNEIYEGDVVEYKDFSSGLYLFREQPKTTGIIKINNLLRGIYLKGMGTFEGSKVEVIGNIFENKELLEESE